MKKMLIILTMFMVMQPVAAAANPSADGCPGDGFELRPVSDFPSPPYMVPSAVDEAGNQDGLICARELGKGVKTALGVDDTVYLFEDNDLQMP